jgi:exoribonuclease-2
MLPYVLSTEAASLGGEGERPALTFEIDVTGEGGILGVEPKLTLLSRVRRLSYEEADALMEEGGEAEEASMVRRLHELALARLRRRAAAGAIVLKRRELVVRAEEGRVEVRLIDPATPSRLLVSEMMILAGEAMGRWLSERAIPAIYRLQPPPDEPVPGGTHGLDEEVDPVVARRIMRGLRPSEVRTTPGHHHGLGLPSYVQVTSPLRRYQDLAVHRQLRAVLRGEEPPYDERGIQRVAATTEDAERAARVAERESRDFWLLRYLEERLGEEVEAVVLECGRRTLVHLLPYVQTAVLPARDHHEEGMRLTVRIARVRARAGILRVEEGEGS